jgi:hypothetical protein
MGLFHRGADAENKKETDVCECSPEIDGSTTEPVGKRPRERVGNELKTRIDQIKLERFVGLDSGF